MCDQSMDELSQPARLKKLPRLKPRGGLKVMYAAIRALLLRELQTRFGHYRLGYLWVFLEPLFSIGIMMVVFCICHTCCIEAKV